jgi:hypothetical protein
VCATHRHRERGEFLLSGSNNRLVPWKRVPYVCVCVWLFFFTLDIICWCYYPGSYTHVSQSSSGSQKLQFLCFSSGERAKEIIVPLVPNNIFVSVCVAAKNAASLHPTLAFFGSEWVTRRNSILSSERARIEFAQVHTPQRWKRFHLCEWVRASLKHHSFDTCVPFQNTNWHILLKRAISCFRSRWNFVEKKTLWCLCTWCL